MHYKIWASLCFFLKNSLIQIYSFHYLRSIRTYKKTYISIWYCIAVLIFANNVYSNGSEYEISGIGHHYLANGEKGSIGLNVISTSLVGSWLRYSDPEAGLYFICTLITNMNVLGNSATITGEGTVQGSAGYTFTAIINDATPDTINMEILQSDGSVFFQTGTVDITRGNFMISALN